MATACEKDLSEMRDTGQRSRGLHSSALLDFDGDGALDFVYGTEGESSPAPEDDAPGKQFYLSVLRGRSDCTFDGSAPIRLAEASNTGAGFSGVWIVDVNGDGFGDFVSVGLLRSGKISDVQVSLMILFTHANGTFERADVK